MNCDNKKSKFSGLFIFKRTTMMFLLLYFILGVGITYAYFAYQIQKDNVIVGNIVSIDADLEVDLMVGETTNLVPMMGAALSNAINGIGSDNGPCIDSLGNLSCQVYKITLINKGSRLDHLKGTVELYAKDGEGNVYTNLKWRELTGLTTIKDGSSINGMNKTTLASNVTLQFNETKTWYIAVWLDEINDDQREMDKGNFGGTVTFEVSEEETWETTSMMVTGSEFRDSIPAATTDIIFTNIVAPADATTTDLTVAQDGSIVSWLEGTTYYVSSQEVKTKILANENCSEMFRNYSSSFVVESIDLEYLDVSNVTDMSQMFYGCNELTLISLGEKWNTSNVTNMDEMFRNCGSLSLDCSGWNVSGVTSYDNFNYSASGVVSPWEYVAKNFGAYIYNNIERLISTDIEAPSNATISDFSANGTGSVVSWQEGNTLYISSQREGTKIMLPANSSNLFSSSLTGNLKYLDLSNFNTSMVTVMDRMFSSTGYSVGSVEIIGIENWYTSNVTSMNYLFGNADIANNVNCSLWDVSNVTTHDNFASSSNVIQPNWKN